MGKAVVWRSQIQATDRSVIDGLDRRDRNFSIAPVSKMQVSPSL